MHRTLSTETPRGPYVAILRLRFGNSPTMIWIEPASLARPSQFEGLTGAKPFRISEGYPRVFTAEKGAATYFGVVWEALIRGGG